MEINHLYDLFLENRTISTDSRNIIPGCMFFALKGDNFNGNHYALEAVEKGARFAFVDEDPPHAHPKIIKVDHVLNTLQQLARYHRIKTGIPVLAITGSNGKTTTKELCRAILSVKYRTFATTGNLNNHIGVPLTLLAIDGTTEFGIVEMGANHAGEIRQLCEIALPDYGLITNVGKAHLEGFGSLQGVAKAKGELFTHLMQNGKTIFANYGNSYIRRLVPYDYPGLLWYNGKEGPEVESSFSGPFLRLKIRHGNRKLDVSTRLLGTYNAENVLAACCVGLHFGIAGSAIEKAVLDYEPRNNRSQLVETGKNTIFMDAYNANPSSMYAAINDFIHFSGLNKLLILGEMRELGDSSETEHEYLIRHLVNQGVKNVVCVGSGFMQSALKAGYKYAETTDQLITWLSANPLRDHFIFIKGSRRNELEKLLPLL